MQAAEHTAQIAGLHTTLAGSPDAPLTVVLLHGYSMTAADLAPFSHSLGVAAHFVLPDAPLAASGGGRAWWPIDDEARNGAAVRGARDLAHTSPPGIAAARVQLEAFVKELDARYAPRCVVLGGFSQGGMLSLDLTLHGGRRPAGLVLLSSSRITLQEWEPRRSALKDLPVFVSHGRDDADLAFAAGEALMEFISASGARVHWTPFDGAHEIPLVVWRALRKYLGGLVTSRPGQSKEPNGPRARADP